MGGTVKHISIFLSVQVFYLIILNTFALAFYY
jgi:hypothetical protein